MMSDSLRHFSDIPGVPEFTAAELGGKQSDYVLLIPVINEGERIARELARAHDAGVCDKLDVVICDGGSTDGSLDEAFLQSLGVNSLLTKLGPGKQGAQLRMGIWWAMQRGYKGVVTIDGNGKDSIEDAPFLAAKIDEGYDLVQGSRFIEGGQAINTPLSRLLAVRLIHAPVISKTAGQKFTDTTNAFRAYSMRYLKDDKVAPLRDVFGSYELLAYLSVRATQLGMKACEYPVTRAYPDSGETPTKISPIKGNWELLKVLFKNARGKYNPKQD